MSTDPSLGLAPAQRTTKTWRRFRTGVALAVVGVVVWGLVEYDPWFNSQVAIKRDRQPRFEIDPNQPYEISYSTLVLPSGSTKEIVLRHDGQVAIREGQFLNLKNKTKSFTLPAEALAQILRAVETRGVMKMHRSYELKNSFDGLCAGIMLKQGEREKQVSCSNYFPDGFQEFGKDLDTITGPYQEKAEWQVTKR